MESFIRDYKDLFELLSNAVTIIGVILLIIGVYTYNLTKKQLNFAVLNRCIEAFQTKFYSIDENSDLDLLRKYVDFVNEEMFYFEQNYIPKDVALEWIDGMIDYMPICDIKKQLKNTQIPIAAKIHGAELLNSFQRVKKAFIVENKNYKFDLIYSAYKDNKQFEARKKQREELAKEIYGNLK